MANLFETAKKASETKKKDKHVVVNLKPEFEQSLSRMAEINSLLADLEAEKAVLDSEVREEAKKEMINLYNQKRSFPGTLKVVAGKMGFQFITMDKYITIDDVRFAELANKYGNEIVDRETIFSFNNEVLEKNQETISKILMDSKKLSDWAKENLLLSKTTYSVKKGTISNLSAIATEKKIKSIGTIIEDIRPIFSIKAVQSTASVE